MTKTGPNDPSLCGSGNKYKHCCLDRDQEIERASRSLATEKKSDAQDLTYDAWEMLDMDRRKAKKLFWKAIELNPDLADAYNGLACVARESGNLQSAEQFYRIAYEKAKAFLGTKAPGAFSWWGELNTHPYMKARHGLGLVLLATGRYDEAIAEFKELLERNPNDNQGIRYLVAPIYLAKGQIKDALEEFRGYEIHYKSDMPDPHYLLSWGLALYLDRQYEKAAIKFRATFFANPYLISVLLGKKPKMLPIWHSCNLAEPDYALDYLKEWPMLWKNKEGAYNFLRFVWEDPEMQSDRSEWVEHWSKLKELENVSQRRRIIDLSNLLERKAPSHQFSKRINQFLVQNNIYIQ